MQSVVEYMNEGDTNKFIFWKGDDGGVTGRMGYWKDSFMRLNGYDEDMTGNGSEDIDLKYRYQKTPEYCVERGLVYKPDKGTRCKFSAGWSVCNDPGGNVRRGLDEAKIVNVRPDIVSGKSWGKHNGANWKKVQKKNSVIRNDGKCSWNSDIPSKKNCLAKKHS